MIRRSELTTTATEEEMCGAGREDGCYPPPTCIVFLLNDLAFNKYSKVASFPFLSIYHCMTVHV